MRRVRPVLLTLLLVLVAWPLLPACARSGEPRTNVDARVVTADGGPRSGLRVQIDGDEERTDVAGQVAFSDVSTPYDVAVFRQDVLAMAHVFRGVASPAPDLVLADTVYSALAPALAPRTNPRLATVTVPVGNPGASQYWVACLESGDVDLYGCTRIDAATPAPYEIQARWYGPATVGAKLHAVLVQTTNDLPSTFPAYRQGAVGDLAAGSSVTATLGPVGTPAPRKVTATVRPPSALQGTSVTALVRVSDRLLMPITWDRSAASPNLPVPVSTAVQLAVPDIGDAEIVLVGRALVFPCPINPLCVSRSIGWLQNVAEGSDATLDLLAPPAIVTPLAFAADVDPSTPLEIEDSMNGAVTFVATDLNHILSGLVHLASTTTETVTTLPDPAIFQEPLSPQEDYALFAIVVPDVDAPERWMDVFGPMATAEWIGGPGATKEGDVLITPWRIIETR